MRTATAAANNAREEVHKLNYESGLLHRTSGHEERIGAVEVATPSGWYSGDVGDTVIPVPRIHGAVWCRSGHYNTKYE